MTVKKITPSEISEAKRAGFKKKKPKMPKKSSSASVWDNYAARWNNWVDEAKAAIKAHKKKEAIIKAAKAAR
jgi:hypothetical protein